MNLARRVKPHISHSELLKRVHYCPETGVFRCISGPAKKKIGSVNWDGYLVIRIAGKDYMQHRLAWFYMTGEIPSGCIDHIDMNRQNNRFANLRAVSHTTNLQNRKDANSNNATGYLGAHRHHTKFVAKIYVDKKVIILGRFDTPEEAHAVYLNAKRQLHAGCTI